jgi:hypothetical protein
VNQLFDESGSDEELEASPAAGSSDEAEPASSGEDVGDDADPVPQRRGAGAAVPPPPPPFPPCHSPPAAKLPDVCSLHAHCQCPAV